VRYDREKRRLWVAGRRIHHGAVGVVLCVLGALLMWDDRHDYRVWF
jgi:hypothetical protein